MRSVHVGILKASGTAGLGLLAASAAPEVLCAQDAGQVPTRPFGKTGVNVAILSLGGMFDIPNNQLMMRQAVKWGVTYWDTANSYEGGHSELGIGKYFAKYPDDRQRIFLVTKSTAWTLKGMTEHLDLSLERMRTNFIDLFSSTASATSPAWTRTCKSGRRRPKPTARSASSGSAPTATWRSACSAPPVWDGSTAS
jgi:hypothetical protein